MENNFTSLTKTELKRIKKDLLDTIRVSKEMLALPLTEDERDFYQFDYHSALEDYKEITELLKNK